MKLKEHIARSWALLRQSFPDFVAQEDPEVLELLIGEITRWFVLFHYQPLARLYGYIDANNMKHREQRHHIEGIIACVYVFSRVYGAKYREIISALAKDHVLADWKEIPESNDYNVWFWKERRGY